MLDALASIAPSCMFFAIGEQLNALTGLLLCLYMTCLLYTSPSPRDA